MQKPIDAGKNFKAPFFIVPLAALALWGVVLCVVIGLANAQTDAPAPAPGATEFA